MGHGTWGNLIPFSFAVSVSFLPGIHGRAIPDCVVVGRLRVRVRPPVNGCQLNQLNSGMGDGVRADSSRVLRRETMSGCSAATSCCSAGSSVRL